MKQKLPPSYQVIGQEGVNTYYSYGGILLVETEEEGGSHSYKLHLQSINLLDLLASRDPFTNTYGFTYHRYSMRVDGNDILVRLTQLKQRYMDYILPVWGVGNQWLPLTVNLHMLSAHVYRPSGILAVRDCFTRQLNSPTIEAGQKGLVSELERNGVTKITQTSTQGLWVSNWHGKRAYFYTPGGKYADITQYLGTSQKQAVQLSQALAGIYRSLKRQNIVKLDLSILQFYRSRYIAYIDGNGVLKRATFNKRILISNYTDITTLPGQRIQPMISFKLTHSPLTTNKDNLPEIINTNYKLSNTGKPHFLHTVTAQNGTRLGHIIHIAHSKQPLNPTLHFLGLPYYTGLPDLQQILTPQAIIKLFPTIDTSKIFNSHSWYFISDTCLTGVAILVDDLISSLVTCEIDIPAPNTTYAYLPYFKGLQDKWVISKI